jgi:hypothetical protein
MSDPGPVVPPARETPAAAPAQAVGRPASSGRSAFVPVLISLLALLAYFGAQVWESLRAREALRAVHASQQQTVDNAAKLRGSLDALAADTQRLANAGNASAGVLVDELRKRGVTINVPVPGAPAAASAPK